MKNTTTVKVYDYADRYQLPPSNLQKYIEWLQNKLDKIPAEHRPSAQTEIYEVGDDTLNYSITYERPENKKEVISRLAAAQASAEAVRLRELAMLEALRRKYEPEV